MSRFFYINSSTSDRSGMRVKLAEPAAGWPSMRKLWRHRNASAARIPSDTRSWRQYEEEAWRSEVSGTVIQRTIQTDFIQSGRTSEPSFYVSKRVIQALDLSGLKGWAAMANQFEVVNENGEFLKKEVFFDIIPLGEAPACDAEFWEPLIEADKVTGYRKCSDQSRKDAAAKQDAATHRRFLPRAETWGGQHFMFAPEAHIYSGILICSRDVLELAHREQWTHAAFQPMDLLGRDYSDFRLRCWPPEKWYPKWHPSYKAELHLQDGEGRLTGKPATTGSDLLAAYPTWESLEAVVPPGNPLDYVKKHAAVLSRASVQVTAEYAWGSANVEELREILKCLRPGPAEDGLLLGLLLEMNSENPSVSDREWYSSLTDDRKNKVNRLLLHPPDELIYDLTHGVYLSGSETRRNIARAFGLDITIPDRPEFDD